LWTETQQRGCEVQDFFLPSRDNKRNDFMVGFERENDEPRCFEAPLVLVRCESPPVLYSELSLYLKKLQGFVF
jgi:hypothetical protein